jgi:hypothetical protein
MSGSAKVHEHHPADSARTVCGRHILDVVAVPPDRRDEVTCRPCAERAPRAVLLAHLEARHKRMAAGGTSRPPRVSRGAALSSLSLRDLQRIHMQDHHRYGPGHLHGVRTNLGPDHRPEGWHTGEHVQDRNTR